MTTSPDASDSEQQAQPKEPRDAAYWSQRIATSGLKLSSVPEGALNLNVEGRQVMSPLQGFGQMWQKTYSIRLRGLQVTPPEVIKTWKENFPKFWPKGNRFAAPLTGISPGEVALISLSVGVGMQLSTGVLVLYADDESFTLMTPQGHIFAGWITFSSFVDEEDTVVQALVLMRANDPIYEIGMRLGASKREDKFWDHTLTAVGEHFGVHEPVKTEVTLIDPRFQWSHAKNIWHNAAMRTMIYRVSAPVRWIRRRGGPTKPTLPAGQ